MNTRAHVLLFLAVAGCIRHTPPIPKPPEGGGLTGTVVERDLASAQLLPVAGASVTVAGSSLYTTTDENGFFQLIRVPIDVLQVDFERGQRGSRPPAKKRVSNVRIVSEGQSVGLGSVEISGTGDLKGSVMLADLPGGAAAEGSTVVVAETALQATVQRDGTFLIGGVPEGTFEVAALRPGYVPGRFSSVQVVPKMQKDLGAVTLGKATNPSVAVNGKAMLVGEMMSGGVSVTFVDATDPAKIVGPVMSSADGSYAINGTVGSVYRAHFSKPGFKPVDLAGLAIADTGAIGLETAYLAPDEACAGGVCDVEPAIDSFSPERAAIGSSVRLRGAGFEMRADHNLVRFGAGAASPAYNITVTSTAAFIDVRVPPGASSGPLTLVTSNGTAVSARSFSVILPPVIRRVSPLTVPVSTEVTVLGSGFDPPFSVSVGGLGAMILRVPTPVGGTGDESFSFKMPQVGAGMQLITVSALGGTATATIAVTPPPVPPYITGFRPAQVAPSAEVVILGTGFSSLGAAGAGDLTVRFAPAVTATPFVLRDDEIHVNVPDGAVTGPVTILGPAVPSGITSPSALTIIPDFPAIHQVVPKVGRTGETIDVYGTNFQRAGVRSVSGVWFSSTNGGRTMGTIVGTPQDGLIHVTVPMDAAPGPLAVDVAETATSTTYEATTPWTFKLLDLVGTATLAFTRGEQGFNQGVGLSAHDDQIFWASYSQGHIVDARTLKESSANPPITLSFVTPGIYGAMQFSPSGTLALYWDVTSQYVTTMHLISLPDFADVGSCPPFPNAVPGAYFAPGGQSQPFAFDLTNGYAYAPAGRASVLRVRMQPGNIACDVLPLPPASNVAASAGLVDALGKRFVTMTDLGLVVYDIDPSSPTFQMYTRTATPTKQTRALAWDPDLDHVWVFDNGLPLGYDVRPGLGPGIVFAGNVPSASGTGPIFQTSDYRWVWVPQCDNTAHACLVDLKNREVARALDPQDDGHGALAVAHDRATFVTITSVNPQTLKRYDLRGADQP